MKLNKILAAPILVLAGAPTLAATSTTSITVTLEVGTGCSITAQNVDFGSLTSAAQTEQTFNVEVTCTSTTTGDLTFVSNTASGTSRYMTNGTTDIEYIILDTSGTALSNTATTSVTVNAGSTATTPFTARRSTLASIPTAGTYNDTVDITYTF